MNEIDPKNDPLYLLTKAVEQGDPKVAKKVKDRLDKTDDPSETVSYTHLTLPTKRIV